jgi:hypothetical protein
VISRVNLGGNTSRITPVAVFSGPSPSYTNPVTSPAIDIRAGLQNLDDAAGVIAVLTAGL